MANHNKPTNGFKKSPQNLNEKKSNGQIERSNAVNCLYRIRTLWGASTIDTNLIAGIEEEVQNGRYDNAIRLLSTIKEPETQNIKLDGGVNVQKLEVSKEDINDILNRTKDLAEEG